MALTDGQLGFKLFYALTQIGELSLEHHALTKLGMQESFQAIAARIAEEVTPPAGLFGVTNRDPRGCKSEHDNRKDQNEADLRTMLG